MSEVTWINGTIDPPQSGEYYVTLEAKQDMVDPVTGTVDYKTGDVMIYTDCYYAGTRFWEQLGKDNPFWGVVCWADSKHGYLEWDRYSDGHGGSSSYKVIAWMSIPTYKEKENG